jgi:hypothetical protein
VTLPFLIGPLTNAQNDFVDKVRRWVKRFGSAPSSALSVSPL